MNKESIEEVKDVLLDFLREDVRELRKDLERAVGYMVGSGWSTEESREFLDRVQAKWFRREDE